MHLDCERNPEEAHTDTQRTCKLQDGLCWDLNPSCWSIAQPCCPHTSISQAIRYDVHTFLYFAPYMYVEYQNYLIWCIVAFRIASALYTVSHLGNSLNIYRVYNLCEGISLYQGVCVCLPTCRSQVSNSSPGGTLCLLVFWLLSAPLVHWSHWLAKEWTRLGLQALIDSWLKGNHKNLQTLGPLGIQFDTPAVDGDLWEYNLTSLHVTAPPPIICNKTSCRATIQKFSQGEKREWLSSEYTNEPEKTALMKYTTQKEN